MMKSSVLLLVVLLLFLQGCYEKVDQFEKRMIEPVEVQVAVREGALFIGDEKESYLLADDAKDYRVIPSPEGSWLAVETQLFSNLEIIRVYKKADDGRYRPLDDAVATKLWRDISTEEGFSIDDVRYPRMGFLSWVDKDTMLINMSGESADKVIDRNVTLLLQ